MGEKEEEKAGEHADDVVVPPQPPPYPPPPSTNLLIPPDLANSISDVLGAAQAFLADQTRTPKWVRFFKYAAPILASFASIVIFLFALFEIIPYMDMYLAEKTADLRRANLDLKSENMKLEEEGKRLSVRNSKLENSRIILALRLREMEVRTKDLRRQMATLNREGEKASTRKAEELLSYFDSYFSSSGSIFDDVFRYIEGNPRKVLLWGVQGRICNSNGALSSIDCRGFPWPEEPGEATALTFQVDPGKCVDFDLVEGRTTLAPVLEPAGP